MSKNKENELICLLISRRKHTQDDKYKQASANVNMAGAGLAASGDAKATVPLVAKHNGHQSSGPI